MLDRLRLAAPKRAEREWGCGVRYSSSFDWKIGLGKDRKGLFTDGPALEGLALGIEPLGLPLLRK